MRSSIEIHDATIGIGSRTLLEEVDFRIDAGEFVAVLGPNGVGKTTLLRTLASVHRVLRGTIELDGREAASISPIERARRVALVASDDTFLDDLCVRDVVATGRYPFHQGWEWNATSKDDEAVAGALQAVNMEAYAGRLFTTLSSGERQRVWIALALAQSAPILLLDEPTSHLDIRAAHEILALLREQTRSGKTVMCAIHDINDALAYADRLMLLGHGRVLALDAPERILESTLLESVYGVSMERVRTPSGALRVFATAMR
jgi:iron complex transport system ATP-binding protein